MMLRRLQFTVVLLYNVALTLAYIFNINNQKAQTHSKIITTSASLSTSITSLYAYSEHDAKNKQPIDDSVAKAANRNLETLLQDTFPRLSYSSLYEREAPDFSKLAPDDPFFLDMSWPTERGPESAAFAKHMQWKRRLSDGERMRWQKWAIYQRIMKKDMFKYRADDYIIQSLIKDLNLKAEYFKNNSPSSLRNNNALNNNNNENELASTSNHVNQQQQQSLHNNNMNIESSLFKAAAQGLLASDEEDIKAVMKSFYTILNHKNFEEIRTLWLPDAGVELVIPGYDRSKGHFEAEKSYRRLIHDSKSFGKINHNIVNVQCYGFIAVVYSVETIEKGSALRVAKKKPSAVLQSSSSSSSSSNTKESPVRILAVTVLRKFNQQWRIMQHHTTTYERSTAAHNYPGEKVEIVDTFQRRMYSSSSSTSTSSTASFSSPIASSSAVGVSSLSSSPPLDIASLINSNNNVNNINNKVNNIKDINSNIDNNKQPPVVSLSSSKLVDSVKTSDDVTANLWNQLKGFLDNDKLKSTAVTQVKPDGSVENIINFSSSSQLSPSSAPLPLQSESSQAVYKTSANINLPTTNSNNNNNNNINKDNKSVTTATSMNEDIKELQRLKEIMMKIGDLETKINSAAANTVGGKNSNGSNNSSGGAVDTKANSDKTSSSTKSSSTFIPKGSVDGYEFKRDENNKLFLSKTMVMSEPIDISTTNMNELIKTDSLYAKATKELTNKSQAGETFSSDMLWKSTSITKKTIQALRYLEKTNQISKEDKNVLLMNIINCISSSSSSSPSSLYYDYDDSSTQSSAVPTTPTPSSLVETSFDLLVMQNYHGSKSELYAWQPSSADGGMDDFLEQCTVLCQSLNTNNNHSSNSNSGGVNGNNGNSSSKNKSSKHVKMNNSNSNLASSGSAGNTLEKKKPSKS